MDKKVKQLLVDLKGNYKDIFPLNYIENIIDKDSRESLKVILSRCNHIFIPFTGEISQTRLAVPAIMRRPGIKITYINPDSEIITESYIGSLTDAGTNNFALDVNWQEEITKSNIEDVIKDLFQNSLKQFFYDLVVEVYEQYTQTK